MYTCVCRLLDIVLLEFRKIRDLLHKWALLLNIDIFISNTPSYVPIPKVVVVGHDERPPLQNLRLPNEAE